MAVRVNIKQMHKSYPNRSNGLVEKSRCLAIVVTSGGCSA